MVTIACVYQPSIDYSDDYVYRLRDSVARHCTADYSFVCLTNRRLKSTETIPLVKSWPGWWAKLELFRPGLFSGRVFYLDLDTMIVGDITDLVTKKQDFAVLSDMYHGERMGSGIMAWNADLDFSHLYSDFSRERIPEYTGVKEKWGDQGWIEQNLALPPERLQSQFPGRIVSYKVDVRKQSRVPDGASIVCFHGKPRPHQINWRLP